LGNKKCIVTIGRLVERKGHDIVLKAMTQILQQIPDLHYLIVGSGPNEISLKKQVSNMGLEKYVTFTGRVPDDEIGAYYELCDIFVMISREIPEKGDLEGFGIVYLEANYFGKPVVAGRSGGVEDAVVHNKTGLLVDPTKSDEVANAIITLLSNSNFAKTLGNTGKTRVINEFSRRKISQKDSFYISSLGGSRNGYGNNTDNADRCFGGSSPAAAYLAIDINPALELVLNQEGKLLMLALRIRGRKSFRSYKP